MTTLTLNTSLLSSRRILAAFSGGLDSTVLLHQLVLWRERHPDVTLRAIHIHHGLSPHADSWVRHCETVCERWQVPLVVERVTLADNGLGIEAHAREARYRAFAQTLLPGEVLATAQHLDDQCETFLLALKRGSGPAGLSAMGECSPFAGTLLLRPLLRETRKTLEQWAVRHGLCWIEDESNQDDAYDRNFLRLRALPLLQQRWPHFPAAVARSATLCAEQERLLDELLASDLTDCITTEGTLRLSPLMSMSDVRRAAILRRWLAMRNAPMPSRDALERIWQEVALARDDASPCLRFGDHEIRRYQSQLWWIKSVAGQHETTVAWPVWQTPLALPAGLGTVQLVPGGELRRPREEESVSIRFKAPGLLHIVGRHGGRKLKKIWQEQGIPPWRRDTTPLLFYGETLIAAAGVFVTREGAAEDKEGVSLVWHA
ncbi:tRNA lysidine(34) synthetase TilS [Salmonella enterica subsp. enterica serovar Kedougou]|uniref:tRNA(Ile)-lysidine synthase n=3 Tax=Salmonella enterica TaxID=28901 RepID=A0A742L4Y4_SALER|nr:tRNA lysidine(34) synthetase TilS [Salmonella enterica]EBW8253137.1 tRNA lysidine(34) synthetase TilS [Salmonella enterica subsp. enterica serovar Typhimurium]EBY5450809.1 tRNA lysidine(34) synthetase TilS [Salmonella enterica subsp. enterica serovar Curacao]ECC3410247.1 tRNA lysidine(34) synthetase TilS [Salmonella enterica subsp. enterica]MCL9529976.1 tRNA lysidine(34) synthetase TilS [Salmonella enterica subsp. enterica serovar Enteritidis]EAA3097166.1 tRNA lysidine(34) synthetase TilS [